MKRILVILIIICQIVACQPFACFTVVNNTDNEIVFSLVGRDSISHSCRVSGHDDYPLFICELLSKSGDVYFEEYMPSKFVTKGWNEEHISYLIKNYLAGIVVVSEQDSLCINDSIKLKQFLCAYNDKSLISLDRRHRFLIRINKKRMNEWSLKYGDK